MRQQAKHLEGEKGRGTQSRLSCADSWIEQELEESEFQDERLGKRFRKLVEQLAEGVGKSIPWACQDWANTKAAYRFFANEKVSQEKILAGHFQSTRERLPVGESAILVLHDTTEFSYKREDMAAIGLIGKATVRKDSQGRPIFFTTCGIYLHSSLVVTSTGLPLGLAAVKFWSREQFQGLQQRRKAHDVPIEEKESIRWLENLRDSTQRLGQAERCVHVGDQEGDIYDLFAVAQQLGDAFSGPHPGRPSGRWRTGNRGGKDPTSSAPGVIPDPPPGSTGGGVGGGAGDSVSAPADSIRPGQEEAVPGIDGDRN